MSTIYEWLIAFWGDFFSIVDPVPDYIVEALNWVSFGILILIILFPLIVLVLVFGTIRSVRSGGGRYDD